MYIFLIMETVSFSFSSQVEQLQLDSMIMTEDGSRENTRGSLPTEFTDMDSAEKVNEEQLDLTVSSSMNSKKLCASWYSTAENKSYIDFQTKIEGGQGRKDIPYCIYSKNCSSFKQPHDNYKCSDMWQVGWSVIVHIRYIVSLYEVFLLTPQLTSMNPWKMRHVIINGLQHFRRRAS